MKTATKRLFIKRCEKLNVTWSDNGYGIAIDAPSGKVFSQYGTHSEMIYFNDSWKRNEIYGELMYAMAEGLSVCSDKDCEICYAGEDLHPTINVYAHE